MIFYQRQIVEVKFRLPPDGDLLRHPCIILSNSEINQEEEGFVAVMLTSQKHYRGDRYSFEIDNSMLTKPHNLDFCCARVHLIGNFINSDVILNSKYANEIRKEPFRRLLSQINTETFLFSLGVDPPKV
jgi:hypothetical protein